MFRPPPLTTSKRIVKSSREYLKHLNLIGTRYVSSHRYNPKHVEETNTTSGHICPALESKYRVFEILGISLERPSISPSRCEKPSISKFLIRNTKYCDRNPRFSV